MLIIYLPNRIRTGTCGRWGAAPPRQVATYYNIYLIFISNSVSLPWAFFHEAHDMAFRDEDLGIGRRGRGKIGKTCIISKSSSKTLVFGGPKSSDWVGR